MDSYRESVEWLAREYGTHELLTAYMMKTFGMTYEAADNAVYEFDLDLERGYSEQFAEPEERTCSICGESIYNDEESLWGHLQMEHPDVFDVIQDWETPYMIEECYDGEAE